MGLSLLIFRKIDLLKFDCLTLKFLLQVTSKKVPTDLLCHSIKKSTCTIGPKQEGELVVTFESMHCCADPKGMEPVGTKVPEPSTCSERTCQEGNPASWFERPVLPGQVVNYGMVQ